MSVWLDFMQLAFLTLAALTVASAVAAMILRRMVHSALCVAVAFGGLAGFYLLLEAEFLGLAQILIYIGAVAILILFAILLTRGPEAEDVPIFSGSWRVGIGIAGLVFLSLAGAILIGLPDPGAPAAEASVPVREIGIELMTGYVLPLEVVAVLLTAATIGAVMIALQERDNAP